MEQRLTAPISERMLDLAELRPGMRILDLATGRGEPAVRAAHRVGPEGRVVGVDISEEMLQMTRERAAREGVTNLDLRVLSAESLEGLPKASFHVALARWGLMYFNAPVSAMKAAHHAMLPGGRFVAAVWAEPERVPYYTLPRRILSKYTSLPPIDPEAPGTFRYAAPERLRQDLEAAGFGVDHTEEHDIAVMEAQSSAELIAWVRAFGLQRHLNELPESIQKEWEHAFIQETQSLWSGGYIRLGGTTRLIIASSIHG